MAVSHSTGFGTIMIYRFAMKTKSIKY